MQQYIFEIDYSQDYRRWTELYSLIKDVKIKNGFSVRLDEVQEKIIKDNDPALAYNFAYTIGYKNYLMQSVILKSRSAKYAVLFAKHIKNADIVSLQNVVLQSKNIKYICRFVCSVPGADKKRAETIVLAECNAKGAHTLIKYAGANPNKFKTIILASGKPRYLYHLAKHVKNKTEFNKIQDLIIKSGSATYIRLLAANFKYADVEKLEQAILDMEDDNHIKKFAMSVKNSKMRNFLILF